MPVSPVEQEIAGTYQIDALRAGWRFQRAWHRARLDLVAHLLPPASDAPALDAAAGAGILTWQFGRRRLVSLDLRAAACRALRAHTPGAHAAAGLLDALPFRTASFDQIYLLEAIEHMAEDDGARTLIELRRVARPGARFLATTPNYRSYWVLLERLLDGLRLTPPMADGQHLCQYDGSRLHRALETAGWRIDRSGSFNLVAPFVGLLSTRAAFHTVSVEAGIAGRAGALLYALCTAV